jgi:hypothetical protein
MVSHGEEGVAEQLVRNVAWNSMARRKKASSRRDNLQKTYSTTNSGIDNVQNEKKRPKKRPKNNII